ncbi:unnamed protein product [Blumeria hordei]|uniref:Uncharacterized protein n=1 Tax=Blumeria hordei TaxID=2867405 RepID=A0A383UUE7_BLUHO|nr:unnamed protein product [Blumeria hordei]
MSPQEPLLILSPGIEIYEWVSNVQSALVNNDCLEHVFHNVPGFEPA